MADLVSPMLYTKIKPQSFLLEKKIFILFNSAEPFEQTDNIPSNRKRHVKSGENWSEKKTLKDYTILFMYIAQRQGQITPRGEQFDCN